MFSTWAVETIGGGFGQSFGRRMPLQARQFDAHRLPQVWRRHRHQLLGVDELLVPLHQGVQRTINSNCKQITICKYNNIIIEDILTV